jgi:hypothetical protein
VIPFGLTAYFAAKNFKPFNVRYCMLVLPAYVLLLGRGLAAWRRDGVRMTLAVVVFFVCGIALGNYYFNPSYQKDDFRAAAEYLESREHGGDGFLIVGNFRPLDYYYEGNLSYRVIWEYELRNAERLREELGELAREHDRLWVLSSRESMTDPRGFFPKLVETHYERQSTRSWPGVRIDLFVVKHAAEEQTTMEEEMVR